MPSIVKSKGEGSFELVPTGTHLAICTTVVNLGPQESPWGIKNKHYIGFEVPSVRVSWTKDKVDHEGPAIIGSRYTSSLSPKAILRGHLESWRGKAFSEAELDGFDLQNLLGVPCLISVVHTDDGKYANIASIMGIPAGMTVPDQEGDTLKYDETDATAAADLGKLPEWMQKLINAGAHEVYTPPPESENPAPQGQHTDFDDSIPF